MNQDRFEGNWKQFGGKVKERLGKRDAEYAVAKEKCDAFAGDAKTNCLNEANARFGKS